MIYNITEIESVFFAAMQNGYASATQEITVPGMPGSRLIEFKQGIYTVKDFWFVAPNTPHSFGQTIIWADEIPVWQMQYMGEYCEEAIPFLKQALKANYEVGNFHGGRGPRLYVANQDGFKYINDTDTPGFTYFQGNETIYKNDVYLGSHRYQGSVLFDVD